MGRDRLRALVSQIPRSESARFMSARRWLAWFEWRARRMVRRASKRLRGRFRRIRKRFRRKRLVAHAVSVWETIRPQRRLEVVHLFEPAASRECAELMFAIESRYDDVASLNAPPEALASRPREHFVPSSFVARVRPALVAGLNSAVVWDRRALLLPGPDDDLDLNPVNLCSHVRRGRGRASLRRNPMLSADRTLPGGVLVTNRLSRNYFHFVLETLQTIVLAECTDTGDGPLIVANTAPWASTLARIVAAGRELVFVPAHAHWSVDDLYFAHLGVFAPDEPSLVHLVGYETRYLREVRDRLRAHLTPGKQPLEAPPSSELVYLSRRNSGSARNVLNSLELEERVRALGGVVLFPEDLSVEQQALIFNDARLVIAPSGAALANLVFCRPGTSVLSLHREGLVNPWYFAPMAAALELDWQIAVGPAAEARDPLHASYTIAVEAVDRAIDACREM
jgi:capsular polysaccharide biosynthesis protein